MSQHVAQQQHLQALSTALDTIESRFFINGSHKAPISLTVGNSTAVFPMSLADAAQQLQTLCSQARTSAFGRYLCVPPEGGAGGRQQQGVPETVCAQL